MSEFTDEQIEQGIAVALEAHDVVAAVALVNRLALQNPRRAEDVMSVMRAGIVLATDATKGAATEVTIVDTA